MNVLRVGIDRLSLDEVLDYILDVVAGGRRALIAHANITGLNLAYEFEWLQTFYNQCDLVYCDGMGVVLAARWLGVSVLERYTLADWVWPLAARAAQQGASLFLLGNPPGVAERAAGKLRLRFPDLRIAGALHGYFDKDPASAENEAIIRQINTADTSILLVGLGMPTQERWLMENWMSLNVNVAITCGALFEYLAGDLPRGPRWMTQHYLEWLARMIISPRRYAGRYLHDLPLFFYRITRQKFSAMSTT